MGTPHMGAMGISHMGDPPHISVPHSRWDPRLAAPVLSFGRRRSGQSARSTSSRGPGIVLEGPKRPQNCPTMALKLPQNGLRRRSWGLPGGVVEQSWAAAPSNGQPHSKHFLNWLDFFGGKRPMSETQKNEHAKDIIKMQGFCNSSFFLPRKNEKVSRNLNFIQKSKFFVHVCWRAGWLDWPACPPARLPGLPACPPVAPAKI